MGWATIRRATDEDRERLQQAARRFIKRHELHRQVESDALSTDGPIAVVEFVVDRARKEGLFPKDIGVPMMPDGGYLERLWRRIVRRALRCPGADGIAWDHVGYHVD